MKKRYIAQTGVALSALGLGTVKFGRNQSVKYPDAFDLPSDPELLNLLDTAKAAGISTLDTAPAYGIAEERLGKLLKGSRQQWEIITKAGENYHLQNDNSTFDFSPQALRISLEKSLKNLKTDYIDCWMIHSDGNDIARLNDEIINTLYKAKQAGLVRSIGMSTKTVEGGEYALQQLDCIMMTASLNHTAENTLFNVAEKLGKSIILKKIYDSGWALADKNKQQMMQQTLQSLFQYQAVSSAIVGTIKPQHLLENIHAYQAAMSEE